jgi:predicted RNase H-like HicB family nuclease
MNPRYHINVFWSDEDSCWIADIPDLRYCSAHGETPEEALSELRVASALWLEVARERYLPIPKPRYRPPMGREFTPSPR